MIVDGYDIAILSYGTIGNEGLKAVNRLSEEGVQVSLVDMRFAKPLDTELLDRVMNKHRVIITMEDAAKVGGFGSAVAEYLSQRAWGGQLIILGVPDTIIEHGTQEELWRDCKLDAESVYNTIKYVRAQTLVQP